MSRVSRRRRGRHLAFVAAAAVVIVAPALLPAAASAAAGGDSGKPAGRTDDPVIQAWVQEVGTDVVDNQEALIQLRDWMQAQPGFAASGYVSSEDDVANKTTAIAWYGPQTPLLGQVIAEGARRGIRVFVRASQWSNAQLHAAIEAVWGQARSGGWAGFKVTAVAAPVGGGSALTVYGSYTSTSAGDAARAAGSALPATVNGIPIEVAAGFAGGVSTGRDNDWAPFDAGGYFISASLHSCSSGFAIWLSGVKRTTTARHCSYGPYHSRDANGSSNQYGSTVAVSGSGGGRVFSASGAPLALDGPWNSDGYYKTVIGYADVTTGNYVCTGGGNSGEHCNIKVVSSYVGFDDGIGVIYGLRGVEQTSGAIAMIQGDSGGPVISLASTSSGQVRAAGMIQGYFSPKGSGSSACGGARDPNNTCSYDVFFTSMRGIVNSLGGSLVTG